MSDKIKKIQEDELRIIFARVIEKALSDSENKDVMAGFDLEDDIPNLLKLMDEPELKEFKAVHRLLGRWALAVNHGEDKLSWNPKITVSEARSLLEEVLSDYKTANPVSNSKIMDFGEQPKGCLFRLF